jgi:hypothetical protein
MRNLETFEVQFFDYDQLIGTIQSAEAGRRVVRARKRGIERNVERPTFSPSKKDFTERLGSR